MRGTGYAQDKAPPAWNKKHDQLDDDDLPVELYNLKDEIQQRHNLAGGHPETVKEFQKLLDQGKPHPLAGESLHVRRAITAVQGRHLAQTSLNDLVLAAGGSKLISPKSGTVLSGGHQRSHGKEEKVAHKRPLLRRV